MKSSVPYSWVNSEQLAACPSVKTKGDFGTGFLRLETATASWTPLSAEGKPHLRVPMVSLCNVPCPAFSLIAELLFHSNDSSFFSSEFRPAAQSIKLVLLKVTTPSLEMGLLREPEEARWLNSLTSQAGVEKKQCIRKDKPTSSLGVGQKEGRTEGKVEERGEMKGREQEKDREK